MGEKKRDREGERKEGRGKKRERERETEGEKEREYVRFKKNYFSLKLNSCKKSMNFSRYDTM